MPSFLLDVQSCSSNTLYDTRLGVFLFLKHDDSYVYVKDCNNEYIKIKLELWKDIDPIVVTAPSVIESALSPSSALAVLPLSPAGTTTQSSSIALPTSQLCQSPCEDDEQSAEHALIRAFSIRPAKSVSIFEALSDDFTTDDESTDYAENDEDEDSIGKDIDEYKDHTKFNASSLFDEDDTQGDFVTSDEDSIERDEVAIELIDDPQTIYELMSLTLWSPQDDSEDSDVDYDDEDADDKADDYEYEDSEEGEDIEVINACSDDEHDIDDNVAQPVAVADSIEDASPFDYAPSDKIDFPEHKIFVYSEPRQKVVVCGNGFERIYRYVGSSFKTFLEKLKVAKSLTVNSMLESNCRLVVKTKQESLARLKGCLIELRDRTGIHGSLSEDRKSVYLSGGKLRTKARIAAHELPLYLDRAICGAITSVPSFTWRGLRF